LYTKHFKKPLFLDVIGYILKPLARSDSESLCKIFNSSIYQLISITSSKLDEDDWYVVSDCFESVIKKMNFKENDKFTISDTKFKNQLSILQTMNDIIFSCYDILNTDVILSFLGSISKTDLNNSNGKSIK
jgi:hypothetical protein